MTNWWTRRRSGLQLAFVLLTALLSPAVAAAEFRQSPCPFIVVEPEVEGKTIICGDLKVEENRELNNTRPLLLKVAIVKSTSSTPGPPVVYLEGGPGGAAVVSVPDYWVNSALRGHGDIIVLDQRGTGYSTPSLDCSGLVDEESEDAVQECRDLLSQQGIDLNAFNSRESAADVAELLETLDIPEATLYGVSYGTRLALTVIRDHPERIRSVILDGVYPLQVQGMEEQAVHGNRAFEVLFADCAANPACDARYPELRETFHEMVDYLNEEPMLDEEGYEIYGDDIVNELFLLLYDTAAIPYVPALIYAAYDGDYEWFQDILDEMEGATPALAEAGENSVAFEAALDARLIRLLGVDDTDELYEALDEMDDEEYDYWISLALGDIDGDSDGVFNSVECHEEVGFNDLGKAYELAEELPSQVAVALLVDVEGQFAHCEVWDVTPATDLENEPVVSEIPALLLSGNYDPITPPAWGDAAAHYLSNSYHFVFPNMGHGTIDSLECPTAIALAFLEDPTREPESSCIGLMGPPRFYLGN